MQEWHCNKIFLATEDRGIEQIFKNVFGDICVTKDKEYVNFDVNKGEYITTFHTSRKNDHYLRGKEYLIEMAILSTCNCLIASRTSGTVGVMMMSGGFEHVLDFNFGRYGMLGID